MTFTLPLHREAPVAKALETASDGRLTAVATETKGIQVVANRSLSSGDLLLECSAIRIGLDPSRWTTHCAFCAATATSQCSLCQVVGFCEECLQVETTSHDKECPALRQFVEVLQNPPSNWLPLDDITSHLLTIRLLACIPAKTIQKTSLLSNPEVDATTTASSDWWALFPYLFAATISPEEQEKSKSIVAACTSLLSSDTTSDKDHTGIATDSGTLIQTQYETILSRILGCSHAITDFSLPLGTQTLGRALFWHHSFYNHACSPNAFLSTTPCSSNTTTTMARVHLLHPVAPGDSITLSYIPLSGLSRKERQDRLDCHYGFTCDCKTCQSPCTIVLPDTADVDSIRQIQYSCNERLLATREVLPNKDPNDNDDEDDDEVENILSLVRMTQRGMERQGIPFNHEVSLEAHRLLAMGLSKLQHYEDAITHHQSWFQHVVVELMDPIAMATQRLAFARDLMAATSTTTNRHEDRSEQEWQRALQELVTAIGPNHPWIQRLREEESSRYHRATKKARKEALDPNQTLR